ncbi:hypothetical protein BN8_01342 [Fibrisoma limi BUZ 3]|uniref:Uncharacterized protein n=1 Tax=Fibrisoma limi BUZ 3 TaxID=1185876 RepID=I2GEM1_9BACT|nr:hypothetical protein [Fibrisoma limi]CCH52346.1 hypothetical protein BN8_01342 [Fibrisoma limi BUZ 3]
MEYFKQLEDKIKQFIESVKADVKSIKNALTQKADKTYVDNQLQRKADKVNIIKFVTVIVPDESEFDTLLEQQVQQSTENNDCRIVQFSFSTVQNNSNYWLVNGIEAGAILTFV